MSSAGRPAAPATAKPHVSGWPRASLRAWWRTGRVAGRTPRPWSRASGAPAAAAGAAGAASTPAWPPRGAPCTNIPAGPSSPRPETRRSNSPARPTSPHAGPATSSGGIVAVTCALADTVRPAGPVIQSSGDLQGRGPGRTYGRGPSTRQEQTMKIQIVNFQLDGIDEDAYRGTCDELAPAFAAVPGLAAKLWLAGRSANTSGGVYVFSDAGAQDAFADSGLVAAGA